MVEELIQLYNLREQIIKIKTLLLITDQKVLKFWEISNKLYKYKNKG